MSWSLARRPHLVKYNRNAGLRDLPCSSLVAGKPPPITWMGEKGHCMAPQSEASSLAGKSATHHQQNASQCVAEDRLGILGGM